jgi:hypothetical protein
MYKEIPSVEIDPSANAKVFPVKEATKPFKIELNRK